MITMNKQVKVSFILILICILQNSFSQTTVDTMIVSTEYTISIKSINEKIYYTAANETTNYLVEQNNLKQQIGLIELKTDNKNIVLKDSLTAEDPFFVSYKYLGFYPIINYYLFSVSYYETNKALLINKKNGKEHYIFGETQLSPSMNFLWNATATIDFDPLPNIIQLWHITQDDLFLLFEYAPIDWIPKGIKWVDENTIYFILNKKDNNVKYMQFKITKK